MNNYYKDQLAKLTGETTIHIRMVNSGGETNWFDLNKESATFLSEWLDKKYKTNQDSFGGDWSTSDIIHQGSEKEITITIDQAREIASDIENNHDADVGINWDVISDAIDSYFE